MLQKVYLFNSFEVNEHLHQLAVTNESFIHKALLLFKTGCCSEWDASCEGGPGGLAVRTTEWTHRKTLFLSVSLLPLSLFPELSFLLWNSCANLYQLSKCKPSACRYSSSGEMERDMADSLTAYGGPRVVALAPSITESRPPGAGTDPVGCTLTAGYESLYNIHKH